MAIIKRKIENLKPGKEYIVTARAKNADVNILSNYTDTIRFRVPTDSTIPQTVFNLRLYQGVENVMFVFDNVTDTDIFTYEYELYSDISGTILVSAGFSDASVFTVSVDNLQTDDQGQGLVPYWGRVRAIDTSNNAGGWTLLVKTDERVPLIDNQFIGSLTASKITAGSIGAHEIILTQPGPQTTITKPPGSAVLRSSNYNGSYNSSTGTWTPGTGGWIITGDGRAEFNNAVIRGKLTSVSLDVGIGDQSFHIDQFGNIWSGADEFGFNRAPFSVTNTGIVRIASGRIDIGSGNTSFHVGQDGRMWMGSDSFDSAGFSVEPYGDAYFKRGLRVGDFSLAIFEGSVGIEGTFTVSGRGESSITSGLRIGSNLIDKPLIAFSPGGFGSYYKGPIGNTKLLIRRTVDVPIYVPGDPLDRQSNWNNQMLTLVNESGPANSPGTNTVAGIAFGVGRLGGFVYGCTLRCFPGTGGESKYISNIAVDQDGQNYDVQPDPAGSGTGTAGLPGINGGSGGNGLDVGNFQGTGFGFIGAASFVIRSSQTTKENIEYMPVETRSMSIERIKNLKPARWDDKAKIAYNKLSEKFIKVNKKWTEKGKTPLTPSPLNWELTEHNCADYDCIGNEFKNCPEVEFHKKRYGFIAEDVAEVFPKAVQYSTLNEPIGIDYAVITYSLVETTQYLLDKIDQLEAKISELTSENNN